MESSTKTEVTKTDLSNSTKAQSIEFVKTMNLKAKLNKAPGIAGGFNKPEEVLELLKEELGADVSVWATYENLKLKGDIPQSHNRFLYQWFCYGYLYFYDFQVKNQPDLHSLFFFWHKKSVTIFISPANGEFGAGEVCFTPKTPPTPPAVSDPPPPPPPPPPPLE